MALFLETCPVSKGVNKHEVIYPLRRDALGCAETIPGNFGAIDGFDLEWLGCA